MQSGISFSAIGSEIIAIATVNDGSGLMDAGLLAFHGADSPLPLVLTVDSLGRHGTINTVHER